jgi:hypothetical protein
MAEAQKTKVRVLVECDFGKPNDVVELDAKQIKAAAGQVDADTNAVAYAESLTK